MATESLDPIALLKETISLDEGKINNCQAFDVEQTEPLNLCLNGKTHLVKYCSESRQKLKKNDDVIFVKEYKVRAAPNRCIFGEKEPRRNPVRQAREKRRFEEYTDGDFDDEIDTEDEMPITPPEKEEDSEDWKIESVPRRPKQKRTIIRKFPHKLGRKKKLKSFEVEEKVPLAELEPLLLSNLSLLKDHIKNVKFLNQLHCENLDPKNERTSSTVEVFKQQLILLRIVKGGDATHVFKYLSEEV